MKMNNKGKSSGLLILLLIVGIVAGGIYIATELGYNPKTQTALGSSDVPQGTYIATGSTALTYAGIDALSEGTAVTGLTTSTSVNGASFVAGITTASPGDKLDVVLNKTWTYHNAYVKGHSVPAKATDVIPVKFNGNATATITMYTTNNIVLNQSGTGSLDTNQTVATGGTYNLGIRFDGSADDTTQDMRCIFESTNGTASDKITLNVPGATYVGTSKPNWYSLAGTLSEVFVYDMKPVADAQSVTGTVQVSTASGQILDDTRILVSCNTKEYFVDSSDGKVRYDVEDSLGTKKSMATYTYTAYLSA